MIGRLAAGGKELDTARVLRRLLLGCFWLVLACGAACTEPGVAQDTSSSERPRYVAHFDARLQPDQGAIAVALRIEQDRPLLLELDLRMPQDRYSDVRSDGEVIRRNERLIWKVPPSGGTLRYRYAVDNKRRNGAYDARLSPAGGLFRGDDVFPAAVALTRERARSISHVRVRGPGDWSVETRYGNTADKAVRVFDAQRRFDRPTGWMLAGPLGIRRDEIAGARISVAAIRGERLRRNDILAFLRWTLPTFVDALGELPKRLLIVGADDPYWRGGLSGPQSLYLHSERPLIGEDGTSTLLHELVHVVTRLRAAPDEDWIVEGTAEFYSLEILRRSGSISEARATAARQALAERGEAVRSLRTSRAAGAVTARAVTLFYALHAELKAVQPDGLDALMRALRAAGHEVPVQFSALAREVRRLGLKESPTLAEMARLGAGSGAD